MRLRRCALWIDEYLFAVRATGIEVMKERPILFNAAMVRALMDGRKTQTRRIAKVETCDTRPLGGASVFITPSGFYVPRTPQDHVSYCPYGQSGDKLWVREAWRTTGDDGRCNDMPPRDLQPHQVWYEADGVAAISEFVGKYRPPMFMPRWASRIMLEITSVLVERVQDISEDDAKAEGAAPSIVGTDLEHLKYRAGFQSLWDSINAKRGFGWETNPWLWVIKFKRVEAFND